MQWRWPRVLTLTVVSMFLTDAAVACRVTAPMPGLSELNKVPPQGYAFIGLVNEILWQGGREPEGIPHSGFSLKVHVLFSFAKPISGAVVVRYGGCDFAPARGQKIINVIAEHAEDGLRVVHYAKYFELVPR